jgi:predicted  nucleic acid-binding Zn-ribbon protein/exosome complex RNA-binding protein Csl4
MAEQRRPHLRDPHDVCVVATAADARAWAERVLDPLRARPLVACSVHPDHGPDGVAQARDGLASWSSRLDVALLTTAEATWELQRRLRPGLAVHGDALRVWHPGCHHGDEPGTHPLLVLGDDPPGWPEREAWVLGALADAPARDVPEAADQLAVVVRIEDDEVVVRLADGSTAVLPLALVVETSGGALAGRLVRVAQGLQVRVVGRDDTGRVVVSALPFAPDPVARLWRQCDLEDTVLGRVVRTRPHGALVELLPGVVGLLHVSEVDEGWVGSVGDRLHRGDVVGVRLVARREDRIHLSMREVDATPLRPALLPDGPPWLPLPPGPPPQGVALTSVAELPRLEPEADEARRSPAVDAARERSTIATVRQDLDDVVTATDRRMELLRVEGRELVEELERDLADVRARVLAALHDTGADVLGPVTEALEAARAEARSLREQLSDLRRRHEDLRAELDEARLRADAAERRAELARGEARRQGDRAAAARAELDDQVPATARFLHALQANWRRRTTADDRERYPWREPALGPDFLASLDRLEGVGLQRVHDVCADVACGRAADRPALGVHPLRATDLSGAPQQVRADGARAFRASLQAHTAAARRLHFWVLPDGGVELARVGYHDDFSI